MVSKALSNKYNNSGFSVVEMVVVISIILVISTISLGYIRPDSLNKKARDEKRLSDISKLDRIISEYRVDHGYLPDVPNILRTSITHPADNPDLLTLPLANGSGWIPVNLVQYSNTLPIDPKNDENYFYSYQTNGFSFELNARLEYFFEYAENDGGNDADVYEVGDDLSII